MFANVYLEVDRHEDALTIPKSALSLESLGDTVYVVDGDVAARRPVQLGYEEADVVEVVSGLAEGAHVIVVGQDGLSDGTPIRILEGPGAERDAPQQARGGPKGEASAPDQRMAAAPGGWGGPPPQMLEACKGKKAGATCSFTSPRSGDDVDGKCQPRRDDPDQLVCRPEGGGGPGGGL
jgi:hypothetical protein